MEVCVSGELVTRDRCKEVHLIFNDGQFMDSGDGPCPSGMETIHGDIHPAPVNLHAHLGDSFMRAPPGMSVEELVAPPDGYKHRMLREATAGTKMKGMVSSLEYLASRGVSTVVDFREGGMEGIELIRRAQGMTGTDVRLLNHGAGGRIPELLLFGRPGESVGDLSELDRLLRECTGIGLSGIADLTPEDIDAIASRVNESSSLLAIHASEREREDMERIIGLDPSLLVHLNMATPSDLELIAGSGAGVAVCPAANDHFGIPSNVGRILEAGIRPGWGSDNAMFDGLDPYRSAARLEYIIREWSGKNGDLPDGSTPEQAAFDIVFTNGRKIINEWKVNHLPHAPLPHGTLAVTVPSDGRRPCGPEGLWTRGKRRAIALMDGIDISSL